MTIQGLATSTDSSMSGSTTVGVSSAPMAPGGPGVPPGSIAELLADLAQHAVHEPARVVGRVALGQVARFADGHPERDLGPPAELEDGDAQEVAVDDRHPLDRPPVGELG